MDDTELELAKKIFNMSNDVHLKFHIDIIMNTTSTKFEKADKMELRGNFAMSAILASEYSVYSFLKLVGEHKNCFSSCKRMQIT